MNVYKECCVYSIFEVIMAYSTSRNVYSNVVV